MFYVTHASHENALSFVEQMIEGHHIACGNVLPIDSCYWWQDTMENETEYVSILKTSTDKANQIRSIMREIHPYDTPCFIHWEVHANDDYATWIDEHVE